MVKILAGAAPKPHFIKLIPLFNGPRSKRYWTCLSDLLTRPARTDHPVRISNSEPSMKLAKPAIKPVKSVSRSPWPRRSRGRAPCRTPPQSVRQACRPTRVPRTTVTLPATAGVSSLCWCSPSLVLLLRTAGRAVGAPRGGTSVRHRGREWSGRRSSPSSRALPTNDTPCWTFHILKIHFMTQCTW